MRTWIKTGTKVAILVTAVAGAAGMAYHRMGARKSALPGGREDLMRDSAATEAADMSMSAVDRMLAGGVPVAGLLGLAITALGAGLALRRRGRGDGAAPQES